ncbi:J domain-containing protein [Rubrimonas cliftonensis]|uniref:DnaJ domain-containing protein n=1 Tax=Rubrimonas cliftonensis TaxID=89524 RepID=A0A1H4BX42_9RHOB|nr:J domain-containing protein [Rubrimonas cliftonensis]SEA52708.1 DnaJ domain-containing protein [Rubrimonas cliftonensis]
MRHRPPLEYDVSVSADKARRARRRSGLAGAVDGAARLCEHPECDRPGLYRAPKGPSELDSFRWFCLDHVREYNARWNFFDGVAEDAFEAQAESARLWERPTWRMGGQPKGPMGAQPHADGRAWERFGFSDPLDVLGANATLNPGKRGRETPQPRARRLPPNLMSAVEVLGVSPDAKKSEMRRRYRALVKDLHPDMNGGDRRDEGRLRRVLWAWDQIKASREITD